MQDTEPYRLPRRAHAQPQRRRVPKKRSRPSWRRRLKLGSMILLAMLVGVTAVGWQRAAGFNDVVSTQGALSARLFGPFSPEVVNVLLLGYSDESREGAFLSDSMNLISVDKRSGVTTMIPIPRDLWVEGIPEVPQNMKINEALRIGYYEKGLAYGAELATKAVARVTGLPVDGWMTLDFQGFQAMVDALGGIVVENPTAFHYTWDEGHWLAGMFEESFASGPLHLDGTQALAYSRARYTSVVEESSDFARLMRQQRVLQAIRAEATGWAIVSSGPALADALESHLYTNMSVIDLAMLLGHLQPDRRLELPEGQILQASTNTLGQYILVVVGQSTTDDYRPLHRFISDGLTASEVSS